MMLQRLCMVWGLRLVVRNEEARALRGSYGLSIGGFLSPKAGKIITLLNDLKFCFDIWFHQLEIEGVTQNVIYGFESKGVKFQW